MSQGRYSKSWNLGTVLVIHWQFPAFTFARRLQVPADPFLVLLSLGDWWVLIRNPWRQND